MRVIDFGAGASPWISIDDVVMGGRSASVMEIERGIAVFRGEVSLANNGGFASVRSTPANYDLSDYDGLLLRLRGDGKRYAVRLRTTEDYAGVSYQIKIEPPDGEWRHVFLPFAEFEPVYRGRKVSGHPALDPTRVRTFGFMIADTQEGRFRLEVEWLAASRKGAAR